ncbi:MAG: S8 family serine peptidase [Proteobacteria bacterium]|nr:S8 family serine peptidase [Pseudomonadota bacterium]
MRYLGTKYTGKGVSVAIVDSGIDIHDSRMENVEIEGWNIELGATGHALVRADFDDENGHGTDIAAAVHRLAPEAKLVGIKIMGKSLRTSANLMAAGIETAAQHGCQIINLSLGTPNMGKALLLRDCCHNAVHAGSVVLAAAHPKGEQAYPADLPETLGIAAHPDCPIDKFFFFNPERFPKSKWGALSGKFLTHGYDFNHDGTRNRYRGSLMATAYMSGRAACLAQALMSQTAQTLVENLCRQALIPMPEIGYA